MLRFFDLSSGRAATVASRWWIRRTRNDARGGMKDRPRLRGDAWWIFARPGCASECASSRRRGRHERTSQFPRRADHHSSVEVGTPARASGSKFKRSRPEASLPRAATRASTSDRREGVVVMARPLSRSPSPRRSSPPDSTARRRPPISRSLVFPPRVGSPLRETTTANGTRARSDRDRRRHRS
jgi:hypothetical protein